MFEDCGFYITILSERSLCLVVDDPILRKECVVALYKLCKAYRDKKEVR